ncbi:MAG: hypothetical protein JWQ35_890 [Bacteriovoracaceae bacterium]|nr:hypothetical protein [Bacteriovoracaceae bacterium]
MSKASREFLRYKVVDLHTLKSEMESVNAPLQMSTFSAGGCGFYCVEQVPALVASSKRVFCTFTMEGVLPSPVRVQGNLVYSREIVANDKRVNFYGVHFIKPHRELVTPIIDHLNKLHKAGQIQLAE